MNIEQIGILFIGSGIILFVYWFFFGKKEEVIHVTDSSVTIKVDAGYSPSSIMVKKNNQVTLKITRTDPSDCLADIIIPEFNINKNLPLNQEVTIDLSPSQAGEFPFHCGMNMFHGKIIVRD